MPRIYLRIRCSVDLTDTVVFGECSIHLAF